MVRSIKYEASLWDAKSAIRGIISGSIIIGSLFNNYGEMAQAILFLFGVLILIDSLVPVGGVRYTMTIVEFAVAGGIITFVLSTLNQSFYWMLLVILGALLFYMIKVFRKVSYLRE